MIERVYNFHLSFFENTWAEWKRKKLENEKNFGPLPKFFSIHKEILFRVWLDTGISRETAIDRKNDTSDEAGSLAIR